MLPERPTREQLIALARSDPGAVANLVLMLRDRVEALEAGVRELERNTTRSPAAAAVARLRRIAAASPPSQTREPAGKIRSHAVQADLSCRGNAQPVRYPTASANIVSVLGQAARTAGRFSVKATGRGMPRIVRGDRFSNFPSFALRLSGGVPSLPDLRHGDCCQLFCRREIAAPRRREPSIRSSRL